MTAPASPLPQKGVDESPSAVTATGAIPVLLIADDAYAPFLAVTAYSIMEHTARDVAFHIVDGGISADNTLLIRQTLVPFPNCTLTFHDVAPLNLKRFAGFSHYSVFTYARFFVADIMAGFHKVIYLDVDVVVMEDIAHLFEHNLGRHAVGAVLEDYYPNNYRNLKENLYPEYDGGERYFNAGVLLLDVDKFRDGGYKERLADLTMELGETALTHGYAICPDQDALNIVFANNFQPLGYRFNYQPACFALFEEKHPVDAALTDRYPAIIHYTAAKPWKNARTAKNENFWAVARKTAFRDALLASYPKKGFRVYLFGFIPFLCCHTDAYKRTILKLFGVPLVKREESDAKVKYYLFAFLHVMTIKKK